jgi:hypothetical protein
MTNDNSELIGTLQVARHEILHLRRSNEIMAAKLDVYETFKRLIMGTPPAQGMSPDICFEIEKQVSRLERKGAR